MDINTVVAGVPIVALTIALAQIVKGYVAHKWIPLISLGLGIGLVALAMKGFSIEVLMLGLVVGLTASGTFSGVKAIAGK